VLGLRSVNQYLAPGLILEVLSRGSPRVNQTSFLDYFNDPQRDQFDWPLTIHSERCSWLPVIRLQCPNRAFENNPNLNHIGNDGSPVGQLPKFFEKLVLYRPLRNRRNLIARRQIKTRPIHAQGVANRGP
jgi:hypothetical protein